jgi:hypothetical protein
VIWKILAGSACHPVDQQGCGNKELHAPWRLPALKQHMACFMVWLQARQELPSLRGRRAVVIQQAAWIAASRSQNNDEEFDRSLIQLVCYNAIAAWIESVRTNRQYRACVVTAAANWRSAVELALMGMKR